MYTQQNVYKVVIAVFYAHNLPRITRPMELTNSFKCPTMCISVSTIIRNVFIAIDVSVFSVGHGGEWMNGGRREGRKRKRGEVEKRSGRETKRVDGDEDGYEKGERG